MAGSAVLTKAPAARPDREPRQPRTRVRLLAAVQGVVGLLLTGGGAGLGLRHLSKSGLSAVTVLGLVLLALGLVLVGRSVRTLWRAGRGWRLLWLVPAVPAAFVLLLSVGIAVAATVVPPTPVEQAAPSIGGVQLREVSLTARDGVRLAAWWAPGTNQAAVVLLHGSGSNRTGTVDQAAVLARHGYGVLLLDARGHGGSDGRGMDFGWYGDQDVQAALDHLASRPGVDPARLAVLGLSMGGEEAVGAAAADPRIRAVVAEGVTSRTAEDKAAWLPGGIAGTVQRGIDRLTYGLVDLLTPAPRPIPLHDAVAEATRTPFLLITAEEVPDEARAAEALRWVAPDRVDVWTVEDAGHTAGLRTAPAEWEDRVLGFLDTQLPAVAGG